METDERVPGSAPGNTDWEALARFLAGESPAEEVDAVRGWLSEHPDRQAVLDALDRAMTAGATPPPAELDVDAALARVHRRMDEPIVRPLRRPPSTETARRGWRSPVLGAAAAVLLAVGGWFGGQALRDGDPAARVAYATETGERQTVRLPDGTSVLLGPDSRVTLPRDYGRRDRVVELVGQAMFDVPHDDSRPFTVHAGGARVRDIGTAFSVLSGPAGVRVVVTEGAVALAPAAGDAQGVILRKGERGVLAAAGDAPQRAAATAEDLAWTRGELVFRDAPLAQVAAELRRWYGVELRADGAVAGRRLTASFQGEPRERVLEVVAMALGAEMNVRGDTAVLHAVGTPR